MATHSENVKQWIGGDVSIQHVIKYGLNGSSLKEGDRRGVQDFERQGR